jgi:hypothetical protein
VLGVAVGVGGRIGWRALAAHPGLAVREIEVVGTEHAAEEELRALAGVVVGDHWLDLDRDAIRFRLRSHPWVADARVRRPGPGRVRLVVEECEPVARIRVAGEVHGVCRDLRVVPAVDGSTLPVIAVTSAGRGGSGTNPEILARGVDYVAALEDLGLGETEAFEVEVGGECDRIRFPRRGFDVRVEAPMPATAAARNAAAFLERLDAEGASRGTLRLISEETAVWRAA